MCAAAGLLSACATPPPPPQPRVNYSETRLFGDSALALTDERISGFRHTTGKTPLYWGRYVCHNNPQYNLSPEELDLFRRSRIEPIVILQPGQSTLSGGATEATHAAQCLKANLDVLAREFRFPSDLMIFLDVENGTQLSPEYLEALVSGLQENGVLRGEVRFGVYLSGSHSGDLRALINSAIADGAPISTVWMARYLNGCGPLAYWQENNTPELGTVNVSEELWQYAADCHADGSYAGASFDLNAVRPPTYSLVGREFDRPRPSANDDD